MRKTFYFFVFIAIFTMAISSCGGKSPIWDRDPVTGELHQDFPLDTFHILADREDTVAQDRLVKRYYTILTRNVVRYCESKNINLRSNESIHFVRGSGYAKQVLSGDGNTYNGKFKHELIVIINDSISGYHDTLFLACGNGMLLPLKFNEYHDYGPAKQWKFTIEKGEGLAHHLPDINEWVTVAKKFPVPIKDESGNFVSPDRCLLYLGAYTSLLYPGDVIDMVNNKVYNKYDQEVDFNRRIAETNKANAARAAKANKRRHR